MCFVKTPGFPSLMLCYIKMNNRLEFIFVRPGATLPIYATPGSTCMDVFACTTESITILPGSISLIDTGITCLLPPDAELQVRPRSGLALKHGITVLNTPGTIDSDYRGEIKIILINHGTAPYVVNNGDRIAQLSYNKYTRATPALHDSMPDIVNSNVRGMNGFGSTGV